MGEFILEHKKISYFLGFLMIFYFFVVNPLETTFQYKKNLLTKNERVKNIEIKNKIILEKIQELIVEKESAEERYKKIAEKGSNFISVGEYQNYLHRFMEKYDVEIIETARSEQKENRYIIPYTVMGKEKDIMDFIWETEKDEKINLMQGAVEFTREDENINFRFSTGVRINNIKENFELDKTEKRKREILTGENKNLQIAKFMLIDNNKGIFYIFSEGENPKRYYLKNNEKTVIEREEYFVNLEENRLILKDSETMEKIVIFDLGEKRNGNDDRDKEGKKDKNQK